MYRYILILIVGVFSCTSPEPPYKLPSGAIKLISNDSTKTWKLAQRFNNKTRVNMGNCFLSYRQTFGVNMTLVDNNGENMDCGESLNANWEFAKDKNENYYLKVKSKQLPELMNTEKDFKLFKIKRLSSNLLIVEYKHKQFTDKLTTVMDVYIPENATISNRNFHW
jgi:hypothetical protein